MCMHPCSLPHRKQVGVAGDGVVGGQGDLLHTHTGSHYTHGERRCSHTQSWLLQHVVWHANDVAGDGVIATIRYADETAFVLSIMHCMEPHGSAHPMPTCTGRQHTRQKQVHAISPTGKTWHDPMVPEPHVHAGQRTLN